jgi:hypothetical protein
MSVQRINNCSKLDERNSGTEKSHYLIHGWSAAIAAWLTMAKRGNDLLKLIFIKARPMRGGGGRRQSTPARYHCLQSLYTYIHTNIHSAEKQNVRPFVSSFDAPRWARSERFVRKLLLHSAAPTRAPLFAAHTHTQRSNSRAHKPNGYIEYDVEKRKILSTF